MDFTIAVGARTPLYLPLYVAAAKDFYELAPEGAAFRIGEPADQGDGDDHVKKAMITGDAEFGVCDPRVVFGEERLVAIASLVSRAGFWIYRAGSNGEKISDLSKFRATTVITYPVGMTGQLLAARTIFDKAKFVALKGLAEGADFTALTHDPDPNAVLVTSDILTGERFERQGSVKCIYSYSCDRHHGNLLTTAVIAKREMLDPSCTEYTRGLIKALQIACIEIAYGPRDPEIVHALTTRMQVAGDGTDRALIVGVITKICTAEALFSTRLGIDESTWARVEASVDGPGAGESRPEIADHARRELLIKPAIESLKARNIGGSPDRRSPLWTRALGWLRDRPVAFVVTIVILLATCWFNGLRQVVAALADVCTIVARFGGRLIR